MNFVIFDLEATCWNEKTSLQNEIIEIGAVLVNEQMEITGEFCEFVKPRLNPVLSEFCTELTTITQEEVDAAKPFPEVLKRFQNWFEMEKGGYLLCSWGFYDRKQLTKDCALHQLDIDWLKKHISVKHQFAELKGLGNAVELPEALRLEHFKLDGTYHRGIDDARNSAKIFMKNFGQWKVD